MAQVNINWGESWRNSCGLKTQRKQYSNNGGIAITDASTLYTIKFEEEQKRVLQGYVKYDETWFQITKINFQDEETTVIYVIAEDGEEYNVLSDEAEEIMFSIK